MVRKYPVHLDHCRKYIGLTYPRRASSRNVGSIVVLVPLDWKVKKGRVVSMGSDPNATGVIVVACHLQWRPTNVDIKLLQTHMLLEEAEVVRQRFGKFASNLGILFCGDFNSQPDSMAYEYVRSGKVDLEKWKSLQTHIEGFKRKNKYYHKKERESEKVLELNFGHSFKFHSTYEDYRECKEEPLVTNWTENFKGCLDYIFYTPQFTLSKRLALFSEQELNERGITSLPNEHFPSDHLPLGAVFRMAPYIRPEKEEEEEQEEQEQDKQDKQDKKEGQKGEPKEQADKKEGNQEETQANGDEETAEGGD